MNLTFSLPSLCALRHGSETLATFNDPQSILALVDNTGYAFSLGETNLLAGTPFCGKASWVLERDNIVRYLPCFPRYPPHFWGHV